MNRDTPEGISLPFIPASLVVRLVQSKQLANRKGISADNESEAAF